MRFRNSDFGIRIRSRVSELTQVTPRERASRNPKSEVRNRGFQVRIGLYAVALAALLGLPASAGAQQPTTAASQPAASSVPSIGEVLRAVNKATDAKEGGGDWSAPVKLAVVFAVLAVLPSLLVMMTAFTRIVIVLSFVRRALTTQTIPPTSALVGLALFLTLFTMSPTFGRMNDEALQPYLRNELPFDEVASRSNNLLKEFMVRQIRGADLDLFLSMGGIERPKTVEELPSYVAIPAFAISEFRKAFEMGCLLFIPFVLVDLVIGGILLAAGMMMLPPAMISLPFKIILFVLVDGWSLLARTLVGSFN